MRLARSGLFALTAVLILTTSAHAGQVAVHGDFVQIARGDRVESRLVFRFNDGSVHDEAVIFSHWVAFTLLSYRIVQRGPSFPEAVEASMDRASGLYEVRYRATRTVRGRLGGGRRGPLRR